MSAAKVIVKKVAAYPIPVQLQDRNGVTPGNIVKLTQVGALVETVRNLPLGSNYTLTFALPLLEHSVSCSGIVVKGYTRFGGLVEGMKSNALNEIQIKNISETDRGYIVEFLNQLKRAEKKD